MNRLRRAASAIAALLMTAACTAASTGSANSFVGVETPPVLFMHGFIGSPGCSGADVAKTSAQLGQVLTAKGWNGPLVGVAYYCGDKGGPTIQHAGDGHCDQWPAGAYGSSTPIERLACDFAWWLSATYSRVAIVAHSMGGLIVRYALAQIAAGHPAFPPSGTAVTDVVTISTPYAGADKTAPSVWTSLLGCGGYLECKEMLPGSAFLAELAALPAPASDWTTLGGGPADNVASFVSSSAVTPAHKVNYYAAAPVKYNHTNYLTDVSLSLTEPYRITQPDGVTTSVTGAHSLALTVDELTA